MAPACWKRHIGQRGLCWKRFGNGTLDGAVVLETLWKRHGLRLCANDLQPGISDSRPHSHRRPIAEEGARDQEMPALWPGWRHILVEHTFPFVGEDERLEE